MAMPSSGESWHQWGAAVPQDAGLSRRSHWVGLGSGSHLSLGLPVYAVQLWLLAWSPHGWGIR